MTVLGTKPAGTGEVAATGSPARGTRIRWLAHAGWVTALSAWATARVGRFGFHPSDQGFLLALSWRTLHGEVPHRDVVSARPLGSAVLHVVDFLLPGPLFLMSSLVAMAEIVITTIALAVLLTGCPMARWGPWRTGLVAATALVNLHTFPLMAWHTIDGMLLTALGWASLDSGIRSGRRRLRVAGLLLLGFAALTKQSFAFAPLVGLIMLLVRHRGRGAAAEALCLVAFPLLYLGMVTMAGGLPDAVAQLSGARGAWFDRLFTIWTAEQPREDLLWLAGCGTALLVLHALRWRYHAVAEAAMLPVITLAVLLTLSVVAAGGLARSGDWAVILLWTLLFAAVPRGLAEQRVPWRALAVASLAWMSSLSWGNDSPTLLGGTLALGVLWLLTRDLPGYRLQPLPGRPSPHLEAMVAGLAAVLVVNQFLTDSHDAAPYRDRPQGELHHDLGSVDPSLAGIRTNINTYRYVEQIRACVRQYPAGSVAVLPDNAFVYPAFRVRNPFPMDWPLPPELVADARTRMLDTVRTLNRDQDYLVLFQTVHTLSVPTASALPAATPDAPVAGQSSLEQVIHDGLHGHRIACGSFAGVWAPRPGSPAGLVG
jgi:hypothetical protein